MDSKAVHLRRRLTECLRRVLGNGPPFPPEPCEPKVETSSAATRLIRTFDLVAALLWPPYPWRGFRVWFWRNYYLVRDWREWYA